MNHAVLANARPMIQNRFMINDPKIVKKREKLLSLHASKEILSLEEIFEVDTMARKQAPTI